MENFTPVSALTGGALVGLAAVLLMAFNGRVMGISGIFGQLLRLPAGDTAWRAAFVIGLVVSPLLYGLAVGGIEAPAVTAPTVLVVLGGLLVGFGTRMGAGCTSGHGVCGLARFSRRSIAATATFLAVAVATVFVLRHVLGV
ncbi:MAG: YeeE/YedE thiosulfate transporter family protein [Azospirillaceae bacterium]